jgi:hypothetical protein
MICPLPGPATSSAYLNTTVGLAISNTNWDRHAQQLHKSSTKTHNAERRSLCDEDTEILQIINTCTKASSIQIFSLQNDLSNV